MSSGAVAFHGLRIAWTVEASPRDPIRRLLAAYENDDSSRAPAIAFHVAPGSPMEPSGFRQIFAGEALRTLQRDGELLLLDGEASVHVSADGRRIDVINPDGALDEHGFVESTLLIALAIALDRHGLYYLHAGALVRSDGQRVLIAGDSGVGKSTVTLALMEPGGRVLGDDTVFFTDEGGRPRVLAFARPFHLGSATHAAHPTLHAGPIGRRGKRAVAIGSLSTPPTFAMDAPTLVLFPEITTDATTEALPLTAADAFVLALQASAALADESPARVSARLALVRRLLENARSWRLRLGADCLADPPRIAAVVAALP